VRRYQLKSVRDQISFVLQDTSLSCLYLGNIATAARRLAESDQARRELANATEFIDGCRTATTPWWASAASRCPASTPAHRHCPRDRSGYACSDSRRADGLPDAASERLVIGALIP
jgi:hypothetical protein